MIKPLPDLTIEDVNRFWLYVNRNGPIMRPDLSQCWIWEGAKSPRGYGVFEIRDFTARAPRVAHLILFGEDPYPFEILHECDNPPCVLHIRKGTRLQNMADAVKRNRMPRGERNGARLYPWRLERGEQHHGAKLTDAQCEEIRNLYLAGWNSIQLAAKFGVGFDQICRIVKGESRKTAGGPIQNLRVGAPPVGNFNAASISLETALSILRDAKAELWTDREIAKRYGVSKGIVGGIRRRTKWKNLEQYL